MLLLCSTSDIIRIVTNSLATVDVHASWVDRNGTTDTPGRTNTAIGTGTTTTVVASPASSTARNIRYLSVNNRDASLSSTVTIQHYDGTTSIQLFNATLLPGWQITYNDTAGWVLIDGAGAIVQTPLTGRLVGTTLLTSASGTFTTSSQTNKIIIRGVGGGGGGAGCTSVASAASAGGGGGAGGYVEKTFTVSPSTGYSYTCGALGAGASGALGGTGGNSTFVVGATTVTANGGIGAPVATAVTTLSIYRGGGGGAVSTNGDVNAGGQPGGNGAIVVVATPLGASGGGGSSPFGGGGTPLSAVGNGNSATGFGAGGSGAMTGASVVRTGGSGTAGCWVVYEYS